MYDRDCRVRETLLEKMVKDKIELAQKQSSEIIRRLVVLTLQMQRHTIDEESYDMLINEREECKKIVLSLRDEK